ncbi:MAG: transposase [Bacteroidales bacterium]|nr:transposase [Bacteroidales bacterium]
MKLLCEVPGIKNIIWSIILTKLPELGTLDRRSVAALCGVAPYNRDSGTSLHGVRRTTGGRVAVRNALYLVAMNCARSDGWLKGFYKRLVLNGKPRKVALTALMRKLIIILNMMIAKNIHFDRDYNR